MNVQKAKLHRLYGVVPMFSHRHSGLPAQPGRPAALVTGALLFLCLLLPAAVDRPAHAATVSGEIRVSLTIRDVCTMNTNATPPEVACSAGAPFRVYRDGDFASPDSAALASSFTTSETGESVEIAF
jgi:hypothetical protein